MQSYSARLLHNPPPIHAQQRNPALCRTPTQNPREGCTSIWTCKYILRGSPQQGVSIPVRGVTRFGRMARSIFWHSDLASDPAVISIPVRGASRLRRDGRSRRRRLRIGVSIPVRGIFPLRPAQRATAGNRRRCVSIPVRGIFPLRRVDAGSAVVCGHGCFNPREGHVSVATETINMARVYQAGDCFNPREGHLSVATLFGDSISEANLGTFQSPLGAFVRCDSAKTPKKAAAAKQFQSP